MRGQAGFELKHDFGWRDLVSDVEFNSVNCCQKQSIKLKTGLVIFKK